jgi:CRISPR type IV-associated protein Csf2
MMLRQDDVMLVRDANEMVEAIEGGAETIAAYQEKTLRDRADRAESKANAVKAKELGEHMDVSKKKDVTMMFTVEAIAAGTPMYFRIDLGDDMTDAQVGLVARSVADLVNRQDLGGMVRNGFGRFTADLSLLRDGERTALLKTTENSEKYELAGAAATLQAATTEALATVSLEELVSFYTPRKEKAEKDSKKAGKQADAE